MKDGAEEIDAVFDDDACLIKVGEVFFEASNDDAKAYLLKVQAAKKAEFAALLKEKV